MNKDMPASRVTSKGQTTLWFGGRIGTNRQTFITHCFHNSRHSDEQSRRGSRAFSDA